MLKLSHSKYSYDLWINMTVNLSSQMTRYGVSESFNSFIDGLRETPGLSDKKFRLADINKMAQYLVCRNYGKACLELSYLLWAVVNYPTSDSAHHTTTDTNTDTTNYASPSSPKALANAPLLSFFWLNENITPARFRQAFEQPYSSKQVAITLDKVGLHLSFPQQSFVISATRVGVLAVLFEIIISLAPEKLTLIEKALQGNLDNSVKAIKNLSSELQKQLYQFLAEHLVPAQQQRRFRYISQWLASKDNDKLSNKSSNESYDSYKNYAKNDNHNTKTSSIHLLRDETILSFWQDAAMDETSPGYKLYASAFNDIIEIHQAIQQAKQVFALDNANSIGFNVEGGEYSPDVIEKLVFAETSTTQDYAWLCQTPKFLTKAQWHFIEPLMQKQPFIKNLPLSVARLAIFSQWQASIVQAKRKSSLILQDKLNEIPEQDYLLYQQQLSKQSKVLIQVVLAIAHIFYRQQDSRYLGCILCFLPEVLSQQIKQTLNETMTLLSSAEEVSLDLAAIKINKALFTQSQILLKDSMEFNRVMKMAKSAFNNNNKDGFQHVPDVESLDTYQDGYDALTRCQHIIKIYLTQLSKLWPTSQNCQLNYCSDVSIFKDMFNQLYGDVND